MPAINVSEETFRRLTELAADLKITVEDLVEPTLDRLYASHAPYMNVTAEQRQAAFEESRRLAESLADRYPPGFVIDASREGIYRECPDPRR